MTKQLFLFCLVFASFASRAAADLRSAQALEPSLSSTSYSVHLKEGYHFNDKAPNQLVIDGQALKPQALKARDVQFTLPSNWQSGQATVFVCDDAVTYCESHRLDLKGTTTGATHQSSSPVAPASKSFSRGFIVNDYQRGLAQAKGEKKLLLVEFGARWCPGCIRYEKETFPTAEFANLTRRLIKVKIDIDLFSNFATLEKFKITAVPALIMLTSEGEEIDRLIDFQPMERVRAFVKALEADPTPTENLMARAQNADQKSLEKLGLRLFTAGQYAQSLAAFEKLASPPPSILDAKVIVAQEAFHKDPAQADAFRKTLREAIRAESDTSRSIDWRRTLLERLDKKSEEAKALANEGRALADRLLASPALLKKAVATDFIGEYTGYEKLLVATRRAELIEAAAIDEATGLQGWKDAAKIATDLHIPPRKTGPSLRYLLVLSSAHDWPAAEEQARAILKHDPSNTDVKRRLLRYLVSQNKFTEAVTLGESILDQTEGRNQLWTVEYLAKAYLGAQDKLAAKKLLTGFLARPEMELERVKDSKKSLEELLKLASVTEAAGR